MGAIPCIGRMVQNIDNNGVNPSAYEKFVNYTIQALNPSSPIIAVTYAEALSAAESYIMLLILLIVWVIFAIVIIIMFHQRLISIIAMIVAIALALILITIYYILATTAARDSAYRIAPKFQDSASKTTVYTINAIFRDVLYLATCN